MEELKPCPFCGGKAVLKKVATGIGQDGYWYYVRCASINCTVHVSTCSRPTEKEAVEIWNRRVE